MSEERKRIRCTPCNLVQFVNAKKTCVKCKRSLVLPKEPTPVTPEGCLPMIAVPEKAPFPMTGSRVRDFDFWLSFVFWELRRRSGQTKSALAAKMSRGRRQYVWKVENQYCVPKVQGHGGRFNDYCAALGTTPLYVMQMVECLTLGVQ